MAVRLSVFLLLFVCSTGRSAAQDPSELADRLVAALSSESAERIAEMVSDRVQLGVLTGARVYSRSQSRFVLEEFAASHPPASVSWRDRMEVDGGWFGIAEYRSRSGEAFTVSVLIREGEESWSIVELVIREVN